jgi:tRNA (cytidine32/uridine32-2'-O)-methyltransferase
MDAAIRIVLVETSHPGNIGASARAMRTMGLQELVLVGPKEFPSPAASARAAGADDVLQRARVVDTLADAIADCHFVVGASARLRSVPVPTADARDCAAMLWQRQLAGPVAVVFGPEQSGLSNDAIARCHWLLHIPTDEDFSSLNLAMAVQVICYELRMARPAQTQAVQEASGRVPASAHELEGFNLHLEDVLSRAGFLHPDHPQQMKLKLRRVFQRAAPDQNEINILRGILAALDPDRARYAIARRAPDESA